MAVRLELINLIIPIKNINFSYPGGFDLFREHNISTFAGTFCHDALLFRVGAEDPRDIESHVLYWQQRGLVPYMEKDGITQWKDMCVVESSRAEPTLPCDWIEIDQDNNCAFIRGRPKGRIIGREEMKLFYNL